MVNSIQGRAWKFGSNISTDSIAPGGLLSLRANPPEYAKHVLEDARPDFVLGVQKDDFIVADRNFGCGSSREIAPIIIKLSGVSAVLAKSFGRIFYRNAVNNGMLLIECDKIASTRVTACWSISSTVSSKSRTIRPLPCPLRSAPPKSN